MKGRRMGKGIEGERRYDRMCVREVDVKKK